jgi:hypothetical protein
MSTRQTCKGNNHSQDMTITTPGPLTAGLEYPPSVAWQEFFRLCLHYAAIAEERERQANTTQDAGKRGEEVLTSENA